MFKRLIHYRPLFIVLLIGIILAATFFAGIDIGADNSAKQAINQQLNGVYADVTIMPSYNYMNPISQIQLSSQNVTSAIEDI